LEGILDDEQKIHLGQVIGGFNDEGWRIVVGHTSVIAEPAD